MYTTHQIILICTIVENVHKILTTNYSLMDVEIKQIIVTE